MFKWMQDRKALWLLTILIFIPIIVSTLNSFFAGPIGSLIFILATFVVLVSVLTLIVLIFVPLSKKMWRQSFIRFLILIFILPLIFIGVKSGDYIHLLIMYPHYLQTIAGYSNGQDVPVRIYWGDASVFVLDGFRGRTLIYDSKGTTAKLVGSVWEDSNGFKNYTRHLVGRFYLEETSSE